MKSIAAFIAFQLVWLACAYSDVTGWIWLGPACALLYLSWISFDAISVFTLAGALAAAGLVLDTVLAQLGFVQYLDTAWPAGIAPLWLIALWAAFAGPLMTTFDWLVGRPLLAAALGGIGGPFAYVAGESIGALVILESKTAALAAIGLEWALVTPLGVWLGAKLNARDADIVAGDNAQAESA
jgi:hypothetical protein